MGQQEVFDFLKSREGEWFTSKKISSELDASIGSVTMNLKKLRNSGMIKYRETGKRNIYEYTYDSELVEKFKKLGL